MVWLLLKSEQQFAVTEIHSAKSNFQRNTIQKKFVTRLTALSQDHRLFAATDRFLKKENTQKLSQFDRHQYRDTYIRGGTQIPEFRIRLIIIFLWNLPVSKGTLTITVTIAITKNSRYHGITESFVLYKEKEKKRIIETAGTDRIITKKKKHSEPYIKRSYIRVVFSPKVTFLFTVYLQWRDPMLGAKNLRRAVLRDHQIRRGHAQFKSAYWYPLFTVLGNGNTVCNPYDVR